MIQIIPTILVKNFQEFQDTVKKIEKDFPIAHIDVMDGNFVSNTTFFDVEKIKEIKTPLEYEIHLMVEDPEPYIEQVKNISKIKKILFHIESVFDPIEISKKIQKAGKKAFAVLNPETKVAAIEKYISCVDGIMFMGVHPGFSGQKFIEETVNTIKKLRAINANISIEVDGGVNNTNAKRLSVAGANILAVGSFMYKDKPAIQREKILKSVI